MSTAKWQNIAGSKKLFTLTWYTGLSGYGKKYDGVSNHNNNKGYEVDHHHAENNLKVP